MKSKALVLACLLLLPGTRSNAGAWPQPVDRIEVIVQAQISHSDEEYNFQGDRQDRDPFRKVEFSAYSEWGLWSDLTLLGEIAYSNEQTETVFGDIGTTALRRIELGARYHLFTLDETLYSIQPIAALQVTAESDDPFTTQAGDVDYEIGLTTGRNTSLLGVPVFVDSLTSYRWRPQGRPDQMDFDVTMGATLTEGGTKIFVQSLNFIEIGNETALAGRTRAHKLAASVLFPVHPHLSLQIGVGQTVAGENIVAETVGQLGLWYAF